MAHVGSANEDLKLPLGRSFHGVISNSMESKRKSNHEFKITVLGGSLTVKFLSNNSPRKGVILDPKFELHF